MRTGSTHGLCIANGYRKLMIQTTSRHQLDEWMKELTRLKNECLWVTQHPHQSFAPVRSMMAVAGYIDGRDYLRDVATALDLAQHQIFIADWWLSPYLHLVRDPCNDFFRLDTLLKRKAIQGVKIYVIVYKEFNLAFANNSRHAKKILQTLHPNICVLRYPDHSGSNMILKWAHHEKLVIIDQVITFLGGLDLCYGRDDTADHLLTDYSEDYPQGRFWHGQDYSNPRLANVTRVDNPAYSSVDRAHFPRMPWHDISCVVTGAAARDLARHFIQRWNFIKNVKAKSKQAVSFLVPYRELVLSSSLSPENQSPSLLNNNPERAETATGLSTTTTTTAAATAEMPLASTAADELTNTRFESKIMAQFISQCTPSVSIAQDCQVQVLRSAGAWSNGTSPEISIHEAYVHLIETAVHFIYIENQFFISLTHGTSFVENHVAKALFERIKRASSEKKPFRVVFLLPSLPGFQGDLDDLSAGTLRAITHWQYRSIRHLLAQLDKEKLRSADYIEFFALRNHGFLAGRHVTEQVYIHSKMMMADDRVVIIGSANINDRSLIGVRDSEIAIKIEDMQLVDSVMAGEPWRASRFCLQLRMKLAREHLGEESLPDSLLVDPLSSEYYQNVWRFRAFRNTAIYRDCFRCIPDDAVESWADYSSFKRSKKEYSVKEMEQKLSSVRGHLVLYPVRFLQRENLGEGFSKDIFT